MSDLNSKKGALLFLMQTWVLASGSRRSSDPLFRAQFANACLADVLTLNEEQIPEDVEAACAELMMYQDGYKLGGGEERECPQWFRIQRHGGEAFGDHFYPWSKERSPES